MIYLAKQTDYDGTSILGAAYSEDGAKRIVERAIREWCDWGELTWDNIPERRSDPEMEAYRRRAGRCIARVDEHQDYVVSVIEDVEA